LFVTRRLTPSERRRLLSITRGLPHLRKLREILEHISALFDRRCHTQTALGTLKKLRQWVNRFTWIGDALHKVFAPTLEKALTFLDDTLLPATSNAVERGNRRHHHRDPHRDRVDSTMVDAHQLRDFEIVGGCPKCPPERSAIKQQIEQQDHRDRRAKREQRHHANRQVAAEMN